MSDFVTDGVRRLELAASLTESICSLPAIATLRWCDTAAEAFTQLHPRSVVAVTVAEVSADGRLLAVEGVGAAGADIEAHRLETVRRRVAAGGSLGWAPGDASAWRGAMAARIGAEGADLPWRDGVSSRAWAGMGVEQMLAGCAPLTPDNLHRVIIVECGAMSMSPAFASEDAALLRTTLIPLASRACRAFGEVACEESSFLTPREQQVLDMLSLGMSVKQIASELMRSPHTVHDHVKSLHRKLNASSRGELIARALGHVCLKRDENGKHVQNGNNGHNGHNGQNRQNGAVRESMMMA